MPLPASLAGKRCLDVGTRDGFWAFEMERRGAAEVVAIDLEDVAALDWPEPRPALSDEPSSEMQARERAFDVAHRILGSSVQWRNLSVYDLQPETVGRFDFAFIGTLLLHLRDPIGALMSIRRVLDGELITNDAVSLSTTLMRPKIPAGEMCRKAGFEIVRSGGPYLVKPGPTVQAVTGAREKPLASIVNRMRRRLGMPHAWALCRPR